MTEKKLTKAEDALARGARARLYGSEDAMLAIYRCGSDRGRGANLGAAMACSMFLHDPRLGTLDVLRAQVKPPKSTRPSAKRERYDAAVQALAVIEKLLIERSGVGV